MKNFLVIAVTFFSFVSPVWTNVAPLDPPKLISLSLRPLLEIVQQLGNLAAAGRARTEFWLIPIDWNSIKAVGDWTIFGTYQYNYFCVPVQQGSQKTTMTVTPEPVSMALFGLGADVARCAWDVGCRATDEGRDSRKIGK